MKVICVGGARPNFMKIAPLMEELGRSEAFETILVHTGQHYDQGMSELFFEELGIRPPDYNLNVGSGTHAQQTAKIMIAFEEVCLKEKPDMVIVVGDVNSTIACALVAKKLHIKVAHIEAGLRSFDQRMPEEINRVLTDAISDLLFVTEESGERNLANEGVPKEKTFIVGNIMIDTLVKNRERISRISYAKSLKVKGGYALVTMHRPSNVDEKEKLSEIVQLLNETAKRLTVIFPIHPRTRKNLEAFGLVQELAKDIITTEPVGYLKLVSLLEHAKVVITDSGGIQSEAAYLKKPCITFRENIEAPSTIECGSNHLIPTLSKKEALSTIDAILQGSTPRIRDIAQWDGKTAERIVKILELSARQAPRGETAKKR